MITMELLKYILNGMIKGIDDYEEDLKKNGVDPTGKLGKMLENTQGYEEKMQEKIDEAKDKKENGEENEKRPGKMRRALDKKGKGSKVDPSEDNLNLDDLLEEIK